MKRGTEREVLLKEEEKKTHMYFVKIFLFSVNSLIIGFFSSDDGPLPIVPIDLNGRAQRLRTNLHGRRCVVHIARESYTYSYY